MAKIDTDIDDQVWKDVCHTLALSPQNEGARYQIGRAIGGYKADFINRSDIHPNAVRKLLFDCQKKAKAFAKALAPLVTNLESGAKLSASRQLSLASGLRFDEMSVILAQMHQVTLGCKKALAQIPGRKGPTPQTSRDVLISRLDNVLNVCRRQTSNNAFAKALQILLTTAGSNKIPSPKSLEKAVREIRGNFSASSRRK